MKTSDPLPDKIPWERQCPICTKKHILDYEQETYEEAPGVGKYFAYCRDKKLGYARSTSCKFRRREDGLIEEVKDEKATGWIGGRAPLRRVDS